MVRAALSLAGAFLGVGILGGSAAASQPVAAFDPTQDEFPEGIALDRLGRLYVSLAPLGEIRRLSQEGEWTTLHRFAPGTSGPAVLGLATDREDTLYVAVPSTAPEAHGVWALAKDAAPYRFPGSEYIVFPNGIALGPHGTLYVTDSVSGAIWRVVPGEPASPWLEDETLSGTGAVNVLTGENPPTPLGANGIAYLPGRLLVANTDRKQVVEVPIEHSGRPGAPRMLHVFGGELDFLDGIAVDVAGNAYVLVAGSSQLVRLDHRSGAASVLATHEDDGLSVPTSLAFGTRELSKRTLYLTNFSLPPLVALALGPSAPPTPGVVAVEVSLPGPPLP
jgi:sugar lactone lactonase YvrE